MQPFPTDMRPDDVVSLRYVGPDWIRIPDGIAEPGDSFEATWEQVRKYLSAEWLRGRLVVAEIPQPDTCKGTKANGQPCTAKPRKGQAYCWHHEGQA